MTAMDALTIETDVLVIGSGAGGATAAHVASAAGYQVLVVEEGPHTDATTAPESVPQSFLSLWRHGGLTPAFGTPPIAYAEGRCWGGSTEINSAIVQRAPETVLKEWADAYGVAGASADELAPYYDWVEATVNASETDGPLGAPSEIIQRGATALGYQVEALKRGQHHCVGTNLCSFGCPTGGKQSMSQTLLPQAVGAGAQSLTDCAVTKLLIEGGKAVGAKARRRHPESNGFETLTLRAKHVVLAAGAIQTPVILQRSGLGGPTVGHNLRLHPTIKVLARFPDAVNAEDARLPLYAVTEFMPEMRLGGSVVRPGTLGMALAEDWDQRQHLYGQEAHLGSYYGMVRARSTGRVRAMPFGAAPLVTYNLSDQDWAQLQQALGHLTAVMFAAGAQEVFPSLRGHPGWRQPEEAKAGLQASLPKKNAQLMTIHLFSTCPLGEDERLSPVDSYGQCRAVSGLTIADASLIPTALGVNPQATVMALAKRAVERALDQ